MINRNLKASKSITIEASPEKVWRALTEPEQIAKYLYGTETITDWKIGSPIIFQGEYNGQKYKDKGNVLKNNLHKLIQYDYWSAFSGTEDLSENYSIVTFLIEKPSENEVVFTWMQEGFASEEGQQHSENGLMPMLESIKKLVESF